MSQCSDPALISTAPHYGLRYGSAPATGNFQRFRGRPPLVSPLKSCMGRSFTAVVRTSNSDREVVATPDFSIPVADAWRTSALVTEWSQ
jgi:hypothetical protein